MNIVFETIVILLLKNCAVADQKVCYQFHLKIFGKTTLKVHAIMIILGSALWLFGSQCSLLRPLNTSSVVSSAAT